MWKSFYRRIYFDCKGSLYILAKFVVYFFPYFVYIFLLTVSSQKHLKMRIFVMIMKVNKNLKQIRILANNREKYK